MHPRPPHLHVNSRTQGFFFRGWVFSLHTPRCKDVAGLMAATRSLAFVSHSGLNVRAKCFTCGMKMELSPILTRFALKFFSSKLNKCFGNTITRHSVSVADPSDEMNVSWKKSSGVMKVPPSVEETLSRSAAFLLLSCHSSSNPSSSTPPPLFLGF